MFLLQNTAVPENKGGCSTTAFGARPVSHASCNRADFTNWIRPQMSSGNTIWVVRLAGYRFFQGGTLRPGIQTQLQHPRVVGPPSHRRLSQAPNAATAKAKHAADDSLDPPRDNKWQDPTYPACAANLPLVVPPVLLV